MLLISPTAWEKLGGVAKKAFVRPCQPRSELWIVSLVLGQLRVAEGFRPPPHSLTPKSAQRQKAFIFSAPSLHPPVSLWLSTAGGQVGDKRESEIGSGNQTTQ